MKISDILIQNPNFQTAVNIGYDFGNHDRVKSLVPTESVCKYVKELILPTIFESNLKSRLFVGPYGTGKSHIVLTALSAMWIKDKSLFSNMVLEIEKHDSEFAQMLNQYIENGPKILPLIVSGNSSSLRHSLLRSLKSTLSEAGLDSLLPKTNFTGVIEVLARWNLEYPETLEKFEEIIGESSSSFVNRLLNFDTTAFDEFVKTYPLLTSGGQYDYLADSDIVNIFESVLDRLDGFNINGIYIVYDEFSKYLEANISESTLEDIKLLQDLAELCNRTSSKKQLHLLLISHKSIENYIDSNLDKDKVDGWRGISGRFSELLVEVGAEHNYELMAHALNKSEDKWSRWLRANNSHNHNVLEAVKAKYTQASLLDDNNAELVVYGSYPLHPTTAYLLPRIASKVAQNERTLFTYLCGSEKNSLRRQLNEAEMFVTPDKVFDYFEAAFKKEPLTSEVHKTYLLSKRALDKVEKGSLESKIIKAIALVSIASSYDAIPPSKATIYDIYKDSGYGLQSLDASLESLIESSSLIYLRKSDSHLKLKEYSGVQIEHEIADQIGKLKDTVNPVEILNAFNTTKALYPSRHNEENSIVRFFECLFVSETDLLNGTTTEGNFNPDGNIYFVLPDGSHDLKDLHNYAKEFTEVNPLAVVVIPKKYKTIDSVLYKYGAAQTLKAAASDDVVLSEEYQIVIDDLGGMLDSFISAYFRPELKKSDYYASGKKCADVRRMRQFSELMSHLCDKAFIKTPIITSEALNKNKLTGTALHSRTKILKALCARTLTPNLGFVGNGQETSMIRSLFQNNGVISDLENPVININPKDERIAYTLGTIKKFLLSSKEKDFSALYKELTSSKKGIGLKRGPIPLLLAAVMRVYHNQFSITKDGEEKSVSAELLEDIELYPYKYKITLSNWDEGMSSFVESLARAFGVSDGYTREMLFEAIKRWYVGLPQVTRNTIKNHSDLSRTQDAWSAHRKFLDLIRTTNHGSWSRFFSDLATVFSIDEFGSELAKKVIAEKQFCDEYSNRVIVRLSQELISIFTPKPVKGITLDSAIRDWLDDLPDAVKKHSFDGSVNLIFQGLKGTTPDTALTVSRLAKASSSLRVQDWNDDRFSEFHERIAETKKCIELAALSLNENSASPELVHLTSFDSEGNESKITFTYTQCSKRADLLKQSIVSNINDMGESISHEEKRQVVFEVLRSMC